MKPIQRVSAYRTYDLTQGTIHVLDNPRRLVALMPKRWKATGSTSINLSGNEMKEYEVLEWDEITINLERDHEPRLRPAGIGHALRRLFSA